MIPRLKFQDGPLTNSLLDVIDSLSDFNDAISNLTDVTKISNVHREISPIMNEKLSNLVLYNSIQKLHGEYTNNPYAKDFKRKFDGKVSIKEASDRENRDYQEALLLLEVNKKILEYDLNNVSWSEWFWKYSAYQRSKQSLNMLNDEIKSFKEQPSYSYYRDIHGNDTKREHHEFNHRDAFTRSSMSHSMFEKVKKARE